MMLSDGKTTLPHAGTPQGGNPVVDSDRVKASVVGAGSTDCGGSQKSLRVDHLAQDATSEDNKKKEMQQLIKRHGELLTALSDFLKTSKGNNVNKEVHSKVAFLRSGWTRISELGGIAEAIVPPKTMSAADTQTTPTLAQQRQRQDHDRSGNAEAMDVEQTPKARQFRKAKRRKDRHTPQSAEAQEKKRRKPIKEPVQSRAGGEPASGKPDEEWQVAGEKKARKARSQKQQKPAKQPQKQRGRPTLPNALVIEKKGDLSYAEILSRLKKNESLKEAGDCVQKIRRTNAGKLLIVLTKESSAKASQVYQQIQGALGEDASVTSRIQETDIELKDIAEDTTKEEVFAAVQRELGADTGLTETCIRSLRFAYDKTQIAVVRLAPPAAKKLMDLKVIRIQWSYCRIREVVRPRKCFKCWAFGHLSGSCKSKVDRKNCCIKCGQEGHKVAACSNEARCVLCADSPDKGSTNHIAGSSRCPAYTRALQATLKQRQ